MRWPRLVAAFTLVAIGLIAGGLALIGSAHAARSRPAPRAGTAPLARHTPAKLVGALKSLESQLQRSLATAPPGQRQLPVAPFQLLAPHPTMCFVVAGGCSDIPCVEFARQAAGARAVATASAVVLRLSGPINRNAVSPAGPQNCQGRLGMPRILRVSGR
jgi:hypothetical protein